MRLDEYAAQDALGLAELVRAGEVSASETAELAVRAVEQIDGHLNGVAGMYPDAVEAAADVADGPLRGVPTLLKDLFHGDEGRPTEAGSRLGAGWVSRYRSELVSRLRAAGVVPVGRSTTSEFGVMGTTETLAAGRTCSPWSRDHMAGGSSGGSGAVVGAGIVPVATGSDGGGSIRIPASACGVVGLKPSRGRVTWAPGGEPLVGWAVQFVFSRSVRDAAAFLDLLSPPAPGDPSVAPTPIRPYAEEVAADPGRLRIGLSTEPWSGETANSQVVAACEATASLLASLGHDVSPGRPEFSWEPFLEAMTVIWSASTAQLVDGFAAAVERQVDADTLERPTLSMVEFGRAVTAPQLVTAIDTAAYVGRRVAAFFETHDLLLTPTLGALPAPLGEYRPDQPLEPRQLFSSWSRLESFLPVFNAGGQPAISLPLHTSESGLPIGIQLAAPHGDEATLIRIASQLEQALPWAERVPPLHVSRGPE
jgi:amidase